MTCGISCMLRGGCGLLSACSSVWPCTITYPFPIPLLNLLSPLPLTLSQGGVTEPALCLSPPRRHHSHSHPCLPLTSHPLPPSQRHCLPGWSTHRCAGQSHHTAFVSLRPPSPPLLVHYSLCFLPSLPPPPPPLHLFIHPLPFPSLLIIPPSLPLSLPPFLPPSLFPSLPPSLLPSLPPSLPLSGSSLPHHRGLQWLFGPSADQQCSAFPPPSRRDSPPASHLRASVSCSVTCTGK